MRSLVLVVCSVIFYKYVAVFAADGDACFILPARVSPRKNRVDGIVANFGKSPFWLTVNKIGERQDNSVQEFISCERDVAFSVPAAERRSIVRLQLNATFVEDDTETPRSECSNSTSVEGNGVRKTRASVPADDVLLYAEIPFVQQPRVLIQLSHPVYNPGDYVKYRILLTEGLIKPLDRTDSPLDVTIELQHYTQYTVRSWDVQLHPGEIYSGQYLLTDDRDLGGWNLTVTVGDQTTTKPFEVVDYSDTVHKITIGVDAIYNTEIQLTINAKYTFAKPITGTMTLSLAGGDLPFSPVQRNFAGLAKVKIPMENVLDATMQHPVVRKITVSVSIDTSNGVTSRMYNQSRTIAIHPSEHRLTLQRMVGFVPGRNATVLLKVARLDGNAVGQILVDVDTVKQDEQDSSEEIVESNETVDDRSLPDSFQVSLEPDGTAVLSVPTAETTPHVIFYVTYRSLIHSLRLEPTYFPELFVRIVPTARCVGCGLDGDFKLGIASSHLLDGLVVIQGHHGSDDVANEILITGMDNQTSYFEQRRGQLEGLKNVQLFAKLKDSDTLLQTSVSHEEPRLPYEVHSVLETVNGELAIKVTSPSTSAIVGVAIYEGLLDTGNTEHINRHLMFNGTQYTTTDDFFAAYASQTYVTPGFKRESTVSDDNVPSGKPSTKFNQLLLWEQGNISRHDAVAEFRLKPPAHVNKVTVTAFAFGNSTGLDVAAPMHWERNNVFEIYLHVPYSVKKLESVPVDVYVVNNRDYVLPLVAVKLLNHANEFQFLNNSGRTDATSKQLFGRLERNGVQRAEFLIRPKKLGGIVLEAMAIASNHVVAFGKAVLRTVPESNLKTCNIKRPFTVQDSVMRFSEKLSIPPTIDPGSVKVSLVLHREQSKLATLSASMLMEPLVQTDPSTMVMRASLTLDMLRLAQMEWPERRVAAVAMLKESLDKIDQFRQEDGSFRLNGQRLNPPADCWDTVIAVQALTLANRQLPVKDRRENAVMEALTWLGSRQHTHGYFCENEISSREQRVALTAHALLAVSSMETHAWQYVTVIERARRYLQTAMPVLKDPYYLALGAYAAQFSGRIKTGTASDASVSSTVNSALESLWAQKNSTSTRNSLWWTTLSGRDLEATSYVLLVLVSKKRLLESAPLVNWMKRQPYKQVPLGVTPDSHVPLRALTAYAAQTTFLSQKYTAKVFAEDREQEIYRGTLNHTSARHVLELPATTRRVGFTINGTITGAVEVICSYMESVAAATSRFDISMTRYDDSTENYVFWSICVRFQPRRSHERTGMVTCEISFPSGYIVLDDSVDELEDLDGVVSVINRNDETQTAITFEEITIEGRCFNVTGFQRMRAARMLPGTVKVFDITDPSDAAFETFGVVQ